MSKNAVCVLMDYYDPEENPEDLDINPGVKLPFDIFLKGEPEKLWRSLVRRITKS
jgi:O-methyltransferase